MEHLCLPENVKLLVASQLKQGVPIQKVLDDVKDNVAGSWKRVHLLTILNIERSYHVNSVSRHKGISLLAVKALEVGKWEVKTKVTKHT